MEVRSLRQGPGHRFHLSPRPLFVGLCSLAWIAFVLWLTLPWLDDMADSLTMPVAVILVLCFGILPGVLMAHELSDLIYGDDELEQRH
jgi:hypothetical protein